VLHAVIGVRFIIVILLLKKTAAVGLITIGAQGARTLWHHRDLVWWLYWLCPFLRG
jgi:hypothetical protein